MVRTGTRIGRLVVVLAGLGIATGAGWLVFVWYADSVTDLLGVILVVATALLGIRVAGSIAGSLFPGYNVAEVEVEGTITRESRGVLPAQPGGTPIDDVVEQIERADADGSAEALMVKLNTPGGEVVPSDDVRRAAMAFEGPTIAYTTDLCASGGMWIASGCDELWARDASLIGSVGVIMSQVTAGDLLERAGLTYEGIKAGEYKDALTSLKDMEPDERAYAQGLADDYYEKFVERVVEGTEMSEEAVRDTEARIYMGDEAVEVGLVDELGTREDVEDRLAADLGEDVQVRTFEPHHGLRERVNLGARSIAYSLGAGVAGVLVEDGEVPKLR